jgi:hypothetical protein
MTTTQPKKSRRSGPSSDGQPRDRKRPVKCYVRKEEAAEIKRLADVANMSVAGYLRQAGLQAPIKSVLDYSSAMRVVETCAALRPIGHELRAFLDGKQGADFDANRLIRDIESQLVKVREALETCERMSEELSRR